jgi:hypothetical protein
MDKKWGYALAEAVMAAIAMSGPVRIAVHNQAQQELGQGTIPSLAPHRVDSINCVIVSPEVAATTPVGTFLPLE